jgi:ankyrin repeat protein
MITSDRHELGIIESANGVKADLDEPLISDAMEHPETLRTLLDFGLDANEKGASGRTRLMVAARLDLVQAEILLAHGAVIDAGAGDVVAQTDSASDLLCMSEEAAAADTPERTALSYAVEPGSPELVRLPLDHGADRAARYSAGRRPAGCLERRRGDPAQSAKIAETLK